MKRLVPLLLVPLFLSCTSFPTHVFRTEQAATEMAYGAYVPYTNWLLTAAAKPGISPERVAYLNNVSNQVKQARLRFAATVYATEAMRNAYETNSALKGPLEASLLTLIDQASNVCWTITYWRSQ